jgi:hypothetical protein
MDALRVRFTAYGYGSVLRISIGSFTGMEYSLFFVCFEHCDERVLYPYRWLFRGSEPVRCPTYCLDDRALRRHTHSILPH